MTVSSSTIIRVPAKKIFKFISNSANFPVYISCINEIDKIKPKETCVGQSFTWKFNLAGITLKGKGTIKILEPYHTIVVQTTGDSDSIWTYQLDEIANGTKLDLTVVFSIKEKGLEKIGGNYIIEKLCELISSQIVDNIKVINEIRN